MSLLFECGVDLIEQSVPASCQLPTFGNEGVGKREVGEHLKNGGHLSLLLAH